MFAFLTTATATHLLAANWPALQGHVRGLSEGCISSLFLGDSSVLRPEGQT